MARAEKKESQLAFKRWYIDMLEKITKTRDEVLKNLNAIAKKILDSEIDIPKSMDVYYKGFPEHFKKV
jgi:hypothetical protein